MIVQAMMSASVQSAESSGRARLIRLMPSVVAVLDASPPASPVSTMPREVPSHRTAM